MAETNEGRRSRFSFLSFFPLLTPVFGLYLISLFSLARPGYHSMKFFLLSAMCVLTLMLAAPIAGQTDEIYECGVRFHLSDNCSDTGTTDTNLHIESGLCYSLSSTSSLIYYINDAVEGTGIHYYGTEFCTGSATSTETLTLDLSPGNCVAENQTLPWDRDGDPVRSLSYSMICETFPWDPESISQSDACQIGYFEATGPTSCGQNPAFSLIGNGECRAVSNLGPTPGLGDTVARRYFADPSTDSVEIWGYDFDACLRLPTSVVRISGAPLSQLDCEDFGPYTGVDFEGSGGFDITQTIVTCPIPAVVPEELLYCEVSLGPDTGCDDPVNSPDVYTIKADGSPDACVQNITVVGRAYQSVLMTLRDDGVTLGTFAFYNTTDCTGDFDLETADGPSFTNCIANPPLAGDPPTPVDGFTFNGNTFNNVTSFGFEIGCFNSTVDPPPGSDAGSSLNVGLFSLFASITAIIAAVA